MYFMMYLMYFFLYAFRVVFGFHDDMEYYFVNIKMTWFDARQYCRQNYTDLATISTIEDMSRLKTPSTYTSDTWIGMFDDPASWEGVMGNDSNSWRWSVTGTTSPGGYQNWKDKEPNNYACDNDCVRIINGLWWDAYCGHTLPFVCFTGSLQPGSKHYTVVTASMTWKEARSYCRQHYTDLAMIEDETENDAVASLNPSTWSWIGLYRQPWRWSDGSTSTFTNWASDQPDNVNLNQHCVKVDNYQKWHDTYCYNLFAFHCEKARKRTLLVKLNLQAAVDLSDPSISILNQIQEHLLNMGLTDLNLKWKILPQKSEKK